MSLNYNIGDIVSAGYNIADIADASGLYVLTYWPEKWINEINYGDEVNIKISTGEITGQIIYIDVKAQYTPKDMQTTANKNKDSFKVKISLPAGTAIKPGEDVAVRP
jgi:HlyD family secretion protein